MRQLKKAAAVVLAGVMSLVMLAGCGGGSSSGNSEQVELVNTMLRKNGVNITVSENSSLTDKAEAYAAIKKQVIKIDADAADFDSENVDEAVIQNNQECEDQINEMRDSLFNSHILVRRIGDWQYDDDDCVNDAKCADWLASYVEYLENGDDEGNTATYWANSKRNELGKVKVTGIGIVKVSDVCEDIWKSGCVDYCRHIDSYDEDDDGILHTENFDGWIVMISYE